MAATNTPTTLTGLFKETYGDDVMNLVPEAAKLVRLFPFISKEKENGNLYHQPVILAWEQGFTYSAANGGAFALKSSIAMTMQDAQVNGCEMLLRSQMAYDAAAKASNSKKAFVKATELLVRNMVESATKRLEIAILYGGVGFSRADSSVNASATTTTVTILTGHWAAGIFAGLENATIQFYKVSDGTLVSSGADSIFTITTVDNDNKKILVTGTATGISALDTALAAGDCDIYFNGANANEMAGLDKIITNTGTLFNINAGTYNLWKGNSYSSASANLTFGKILKAVAKGVNRGLDEKATVLCNPDTYATLVSDAAAARRYDGSYNRKKGENGFEMLTFYAQNGELEILPYNIVKEGEAFIIPAKQVKRIGAQDLSFKTPGMDEDIFFHLTENAGYEMRIYTDQSVFLQTPARAIKVTNIVNS